MSAASSKAPAGLHSPVGLATVLVATLPVEPAGSLGSRFGHMTLNSPAFLNCLSLDMVRTLASQLHAWATDATICGVLIDASGDKAFCAGGDLKKLYPELRAKAPGLPLASAFFAEEYALDLAIHQFKKPIVAWVNGIAMGGGVGLMVGASHRVLTENSTLAMPEISVGLYPDVGGSWFLRRMPGRVGLFLALTGATLNAADALFCDLADVVIPQHLKAELLAALARTNWHGNEKDVGADITELLDRFAARTDTLVPSRLREHFDTINALFAGDDLQAMADRVAAYDGADPWLRSALQGFVKGSPTSAAVSVALWRRTRHMSLAEVFQLEYTLSLNFCSHPDFAEGIRAVLVDKDRQPQWSPPKLSRISQPEIEQLFHPAQCQGSPHQTSRAPLTSNNPQETS